ncbi:saccharopine dehydrogenase, partial [Strigomonas culicis]
MAQFDIILIGATGYTGRITAKFLSKQSATTWAMAGRSAAKLQELNKELKTNVSTFEIDVNKPETLDAVCQRARCIISCAGPFTRCGMPVVDACVRNGVHYIDSTGEFNFVRAVIEKHNEEAKRKNIVLVSCCGFDSVPADLGNYVLHRDAKEPVKSVQCYYKLHTAGVSNGTVNSISEVMAVIGRKDLDPCSLNPPEAPRPVAAPTRMLMWWDGRRGFTAPYGMAAINERIVRRTNALMGSRASYVEAMQGGALAMLQA